MQKKAWLVYNTSIASKKFLEVHALYIEAAKKNNVRLEPVKSSDIYSLIHNKNLISSHSSITQPDFILFLEKDLRLAYHLESLGYKLYNSHAAIQNCDDKFLTAQILAKHDIKQPKTLISHLHYSGFIEESHDAGLSVVKDIESHFSYPLIVKEVYGSFGSQVYLINNRQELQNKRKELLLKPHIYQEFIASSKGRDVRLQVVGQKVVAAVLRTSEHDFRANVTNGGIMQPYDPSQQFVDMALRCAKILHVDFAGVDILFGEQDEPILCEVNSNAHIKNISECTSVNVAKHVIDYILQTL